MSADTGQRRAGCRGPAGNSTPLEELPVEVLIFLIGSRYTGLIRRLLTEDDVLYRAFLSEVTEKDLRLRFFASLHEVREDLIEKLIHYDPTAKEKAASRRPSLVASGTR